MVAADVLRTGLRERVAFPMFYNVAKHAHQAEPTQHLEATGPMPQLHVQVCPSIHTALLLVALGHRVNMGQHHCRRQLKNVMSTTSAAGM